METLANMPQTIGLSHSLPGILDGPVAPVATTCTVSASAALLQECQAVMQAALQQPTLNQLAALQPVPAEQRTVFFAGVPPMVTAAQLESVFNRFDAIKRLNLFKPFNSRTSKVSIEGPHTCQQLLHNLLDM
jgi:hypothetical protein